MIPIRDENPTRHVPYVTLVIIALNVAAFLLWEPIFKSDREQQVFFFCNALIPYEITNQTTLAEGGSEARALIERELRADGASVQQVLQRECGEKSWWQSLFVAMFLHGGWLHIAGNMLFLWVFGNNVEDKLRPFGFALFYLAAGIVASFTQIAINANSVIPNLGASGAVAGVLGAYLLMFPRRRVLTLIFFFFITAIYLPAFVVLGLWFVLQLVSGVGSLAPALRGAGGVAFWAHIGGFAFGAIAALLFFPKERQGSAPPPPRPDTWHGRPVRDWGPRPPSRGWGS